MAAAAVIGAIAAALQGGVGVFQTIKGISNAKKYGQMAKGFTTPEEVIKSLQAVQSQQGGDTITRDFEVGQIDRAFSQSLGVAERLGADPNYLSEMFGAKVNSLIKVGQEFHASNMEQFSKLMAAYAAVAEGKSAEWASRDAILKNKLQQAAGDQSSGLANIGSMTNALLSIGASKDMMDLYKLGKIQESPSGINQGGIDYDEFVVNAGRKWGGKKPVPEKYMPKFGK